MFNNRHIRILKNVRIDSLTSAFKEIRPFLDGLESQVKEIVPIAYAAIGNDGMALTSLNLASNVGPVKAKGWLVYLGTTEGVFIGWLTGVFFKEGDMVDIVHSSKNKLYAIYSPQRQLVAMRPGITSGIKFQLQNCLKVYKWIAITLFLLITAILLIINLFSSDSFWTFLYQLPFIIGGALIFPAALVWASSRKELRSARLGTTIFELLDFRDPQHLIIASEERLQKMDQDPGYFFKTDNLIH